jgi:hypothetical protein
MMTHCRHTVLAAILAMGLLTASTAGASALRVYTCDTTIASQPILRIDDQATQAGALVENASLITLPNGMAAVQFSLRYAPRIIPSGRILKVRYTVNWTDDCGRILSNGANTGAGLVLNPNQFQTVQSVAMHPDASRALLNIYVE